MLPVRRMSIVALRNSAPTSGVAALRLQWRQPLAEDEVAVAQEFTIYPSTP